MEIAYLGRKDGEAYGRGDDALIGARQPLRLPHNLGADLSGGREKQFSFPIAATSHRCRRRRRRCSHETYLGKVGKAAPAGDVAKLGPLGWLRAARRAAARRRRRRRLARGDVDQLQLQRAARDEAWTEARGGKVREGVAAQAARR